MKEKYAKYLPHSAGRYQVKRFRKAMCPIVERLACSLMMHGRNNGKKLMAVRIVKHSFEIIFLLTGEVCAVHIFFLWGIFLKKGFIYPCFSDKNQHCSDVLNSFTPYATKCVICGSRLMRVNASIHTPILSFQPDNEIAHA